MVKKTLIRFAFWIVAISFFLGLVVGLKGQSPADPKFGPDITTIKGWWANVYPWVYNPSEATIQPVPELFSPSADQNFNQVRYQNQQLDEYGSGLDIVNLNPNPGSNDYNQLLSVYFTQNTKRPFFILYGIDGDSGYKEPVGQLHDMSDPLNRQVFLSKMNWFMQNVFLKFPSRVATYKGRALIYLWNTDEATGDYASLIEEAKKLYPISFFGSTMSVHNEQDMARIKAFDGTFFYMVGDFQNQGNYLRAITAHRNASFAFRQFLRRNNMERLIIPTFQVAYDDHKLQGRSAVPMYPRNKSEVELHAQLIKDVMDSVYDGMGPFVVYNELYEGGAVCETVSRPEPSDHWVGYGLSRLEILKKFFGKN
ncbi:hypothetical protein KW791_03440 [Candidatus Parcubacteria bacterium]|nr:hypothetical protein [Candidatus Parcubacteria bacterium]